MSLHHFATSNALPDAESPATAFPRIASPLRPRDRVSVEVGKLLDDVRQALKNDLATARDAATRLAALLTSRSRDEARPSLVRGGLAPWQKRNIQKHIEEHLDRALPVEELAKLVSLSTNHFSRAFKESFGDPPHAYIIKARVERAGEMMLTTSERIAEIALSCGFADQAHLCHCFRRAVGMSPAAWRRHATANQPCPYPRAEQGTIGVTLPL